MSINVVMCGWSQLMDVSLDVKDTRMIESKLSSIN